RAPWPRRTAETPPDRKSAMMDRRVLMTAIAAVIGAAAVPARAFETALDPVVDYLRGLVEAGELPFAALRVTRRGRMLAQVHISGAEAIGPDTLYRIYSMTKPVVAAGTVLLVEDGRLTLDTPVAEIVPEFAELTVTGDDPARTMRVGHLLTHTCGLANSWGDGRTSTLYREAGLIAAAWMHDPEIAGLDAFARSLGALPLEFQPGTDWVYGYGLDIAGLVIERISGERLGDFLRRRIFEPLGMASTGFLVPVGQGDRLAGLYAARADGIAPVGNGSERAPLSRPHADAGSGGLVSTLEDYGRFADMLANGGARHDVRVMEADTVRTLFAPWQPQAPLLPS